MLSLETCSCSVARAFALALLGTTTLVGFSTARAEPLSQELQSLVGTHPLIRSSQAQVDAAEKGVRASLAPFLPSVDLTADTGKGEVSNPTFRAAPGGKPFDEDPRSVNLTVKGNIYDGGAKFANREQAKIQLDTAGLTLTSTRQIVIAEGIAAYLNVMRQSELLKLSTQNTENIRKQLNLEDERVKRGSGINVDVLQAKSRLQIALERLTAVRGALDDAQARYDQVFNRPPQVATMSLPPVPVALLPTALDEAVSIALTDSPIVRTANKQIDLTQQRKEAVEAEYLPKIELVGESKYQQDFEGTPGIRRDYTIKLKSTWNLFSGLGTQSRSQQLAYEYEARKEDHVQSRRKAEEAVRIAWTALKTAEQRRDLLENAVAIADEVFENRKKLRESGKETVINVLDAENEGFTARINYTGALYDAQLAAYELLRVMGRLDLNAATGTR
jgi:outer membrane protein, adhesin transport system